jgi:hypothetical protein
MNVIRQASMTLGMLALAGCTTTVAVTDHIPERAALPAGEGMAIGSIVMTTPTGVTDPEKSEMIDALRQRKLTATFRRYVMHGGEEGGEFSWREYVGDNYVLSFGLDAEHRFVIHAPPGRYALREIAASYPGLLGDEKGSSMEGVARFEIQAHKTNYIGMLVVRVEFKSDREQKLAQWIERGDRKWMPGMPERRLEMRVSVTDTKDATLGELVSDSPTEVETELMKVGHPIWHFDVPAPPPLPDVQKQK